MTSAGVDLSISEVTVRFGGLVAVNRVTLSAPGGSITGLIGPNGAGKSTTFNACAGVVPLASGRVTLGGRRLDGLNTARRAREGLGRTFQRMELIESLTAVENVALGPEGMFSSRRPWSQFAGTRNERKHIHARTREAMERCGIAGLADSVVGSLPTGQRRMVELARVMATPFRFLLLDEPSSGLDVAETERFAGVLEDFVASSGVGVLLVEHDMALVSKVCSYIYVLDFGCLIFDGETRAVLASEQVKAAYLGSDAVTDPSDSPAELLEASDV